MLLPLPDKCHHRLVRDRMRRRFPPIRDVRIVHDDRARPFVDTKAERREGARKRRVVVVR